MLRYALRRLLWAIPTLVGISVVSFLFLSYVPDPTEDPVLAQSLSPDDLAAVRRERFLDLPRFLNPFPRDVRVRAEEAVAAIAAGGADAESAARELARLGGAALPHVLPKLDTLPPEPRTRVAIALAPVALRMDLPHSDDAIDPDRASAFWTRFWDDRGVEFRSAGVRSAVRRLTRYGSASRVTELVELDTFALDEVFTALEPPRDDADIDHARALVEIAARVTGRADRIAPGEELAKARACVERWIAYWVVYHTDFVALTGPSRVAASLTETRYGKWALTAVTHRLGLTASGAPVLDEFARRAPITMVILLGAIALAYAAAIPLGALSAAYRGKKTDLGIACTVLGLYALPTAVLAVLFGRRTGPLALRLLVAITVLALGLIAAPTRQQRSALATALSQDYVRAAVARGASRVRALAVHAMRNALVPVVTLAALEAPMALGGAFVVERVLGLDGIGDATIRAVQVRDVSWLMALSLVAGLAAALGVLATDLLYVVIDPRVAPAVFHRRGLR